MTANPVQKASFPDTMSLLLQLRIRRQGWAFSRQDALQFGATDVELRNWCASGAVVRCGHGAYFVADVGGGTYDAESMRRRIRAVLLALGDDYFATHQSAVAAWDLPAVASLDPGQVHIGHQGGRRWSRRNQVRLHRVRHNAPVCRSNEIRTVSAAYGIAQVGASAGLEAAVIAADAALQRGLTTISQLTDAVAEMRGSPGCSRLTTLTDLVDSRSESPGESRLRLILRASGVAVTPQVEIRDEAGRFVARVDLALDDSNVVIEFDGMLKYRGSSNSEALVNEKRRQVAIERLGYRVVRYVWADLDDPERVLTLLR